MKHNQIMEFSAEVMVGTFMFVAILGLCVFTIVLSRENMFKKTFPLEVVFADTMGLREGDNVVMRGMTIGKIKSIALHGEGALVTASLQQPVRLRDGYRITVAVSSMLGGRYLQIYEGTPDSPELGTGAVFQGETPRDVMALASDLAADLKDITGKINMGRGTLGKLVNDDTLYNDARDIVSELKAAVNERGLVKNMESSMENLNEITTKINEGEGTLGMLIGDEELQDEIKRTVADIRAAVDDVRETSPIVTFSSIFFGAF